MLFSSLLDHLKGVYQVKTVITEQVEVELRHHVNDNPKFISLKKGIYAALESRTLTVMDDAFADHYELGPNFLDDIDTEARRLQGLGIDDGESYVHAAASALDAPALTNDLRAVKKLVLDRDHTPKILRSFDIVGFGFQTNHFSAADCERCRKRMVGIGEDVEKLFRRRSFLDGLCMFYVRLVDNQFPRVGASSPVQKYDAYRLEIIEQHG